MPEVADIEFTTERSDFSSRNGPDLMFLLDTSVISELRKPNANHGVRVWAHGITPNRLFLSAITLLELETGILRVERRDPDQGALLRSWLERRVLLAFTGRILPIDNEVALRSIAHSGPQQRVRCINCCNRSGPRADRGYAQRGRLRTLRRTPAQSVAGLNRGALKTVHTAHVN